MQTHPRPRLRLRPRLSFFVLMAMLGVLWMAGGASRADALGQAVVRNAAWLALVMALLFDGPPAFSNARSVWLLLLAAIALPLLQLVPLPPEIWQALPGRDPLAQAASISSATQPWRPWTVVPGATINALFSLVVPVAVLVLTVRTKEGEWAWLPSVLLALITASMLVGLLQFSGATFNNPLINDTVGQISGSFANRNHFALFLAFGCLLAPVWAFLGGRSPGWRAPIALGLILLFALTILASGSRAGLLLGVLALGLGMLLVQRSIRRALSNAPRWVFPALVTAIVGSVTILVLLSVAADRAVSINRALEVDPGQDMRSRALSTVLAMVAKYFPTGAGLGGFNSLFQIHEPDPLLKPTYFNQAHNDFIGIMLDAGLLSLMSVVALVWWSWATFRAWRGPRQRMLPRLGSAMILLVLIASVFDYPARTPMIMAMLVIAATWLSSPPDEEIVFALPRSDQQL